RSTRAWCADLAGRQRLARSSSDGFAWAGSQGGIGPRFERLSAPTMDPPSELQAGSSARPPFAPEQVDHPRPHVVADLADAREGLPLGILEGPIVSTEAGDDRALLAAAHGDQHLGAASELVGELLGRSIAEVDAHLAHDVQHLRVDP